MGPAKPSEFKAPYGEPNPEHIVSQRVHDGPAVALEHMRQAADHESKRAATSPRLRAQRQELMQYLPLRDEIEVIWRDPEQQRAATWTEHQDINEVMLATSLAPDGFLVLLPPEDRD